LFPPRFITTRQRCINSSVQETELYWLAGLLEGEGSFCCGPPSKPNSPYICVEMCDEDVVSRIARLFGMAYHPIKPRKSNHKISYGTRLTGSKAMSLMKSLRSMMSVRRQDQIDRALRSFDPTRLQRRWLHNQKMDGTMIVQAKQRIDAGESLRSVARSYDIHHESLRRRLSL